MVTDPKDMQRRTISTLREELLADVTLENNLLLELNRYLDQLKNHKPEMLRLEALGNHPLIKFGVTTMDKSARANIMNSQNFMSTRTDLMRTIAEKEEIFRITEQSMLLNNSCLDVLKLFAKHMVTDPKDMQRRTISTLREELLADVTLENNLLLELNRYLDQLKNHKPEMLRLEALGNHPLIKFGVTTMDKSARANIMNSQNFMSTRTDLMRTIAEKEEIFRITEQCSMKHVLVIISYAYFS
nr:hypothetical protein [Tanacetum cinerariifolium]